MGWVPFPDLKGLTFGLKALVVAQVMGLTSFVTVYTLMTAGEITVPSWLIGAYFAGLGAAGIDMITDAVAKSKQGVNGG